MRWKKVKLSELGVITTGNTPPKKEQKYYVDGEIPFIKPGNFKKNLISTLEESNEHLTEEGSSKGRMVPKGSVLVTCIGLIGNVGIAQRELCFNQQINAIIPNKEIISNRFLAHSILNKRKYLQHISNAPVVPIINKSQFSEVEISIPSLPEQKRIAVILDKADTICCKRQEVIKLIDDFLRATFLDMFGDPVTNPKGWEIQTVGENLDFLTSGSRGWAKYYSNKGSLFIRIQNIGNNELLLDDITYVEPPESAEARRTKVQSGDILLSITADLGRTAVIPDKFPPAHINQHLALLRFKTLEPLYVSAYLASTGGQRQINSLNREGVKAGLNFDNIKSLKIHVPPLDLQNEWKVIYNKIKELKKFLMKASIQDKELFNALAQNAFKGGLL